METQVSIPEGTKLFRFYRFCVWLGTISLAACILTILIGDLFLNKSVMGGVFTAIAYIFFFLLTLLASYAEMQALNHGKQKLGKGKASGSFRQ